MKIYHTPSAVVVQTERRCFEPRDFSFDQLFRQPEPAAWLRERLREGGQGRIPESLRPPLESQEVWAAGVTYSRSREARMEESKREADIYDRVYEAPRPELFFKATPHRVAGHGGAVRIRADSHWNVPEAELALAINREGRIFGYSIGNDMSSRSLEGDNPLYLPQAKIYDGSCALGPCLLIADEPLPPSTEIELRIARAGAEEYRGSTRLSQLRRAPEELVEYLYRENSFPNGCYLLTGTGIVPPRVFTLAAGDEIEIVIAPVGRLLNRVG
ncbi:MAG TPA: fumarylacetoacetate hydrolase family protein [Steroidobacteraceae bacterium]|nr:fumarylacetoacetate hydrolase family protein [Steroidobacteraceae bacterium]